MEGGVKVANMLARKRGIFLDYLDEPGVLLNGRAMEERNIPEAGKSR